MQQQETIFDITTKSFGGRWTPLLGYLDEQKKRANSTLNFYKNDETLLRSFPKIHYDFVDNNEINAFATKVQDNYVIGVHKATMIILFDLFSKMLSHPEILIEIGNINEETEYTIKTDYYTNLKSMFNKDFDLSKIRNPVNIERQLYAWHLTTLALDFIFEHELSHSMFGHVDYLADLFGINSFSEFQQFSPKDSLLLDLQTLEMDADSTALTRCSNWAIGSVNHPKKMQAATHIFYKDNYQALSDLSFAVYNTIRLFGDGDYKNFTPGKSSHPNPRVRQMMINATFEAIIRINHPEIDHSKLLEMLIEKVELSENAYQLITGNIPNLESILYAIDNPLLKHLEANWKNNLRNTLEKYSYWRLAD